MEAPKKIYVNIGPRQSLVARAGQSLKSDKEYIRKDALLEWAKEWSDRYPYSHEFQMIIDKIESL